MSVQSIVRIITDDTKKIYEYPAPEGERHNLWQVEIRITPVDSNGHVQVRSQYSTYDKADRMIHLERQTLVNAGLQAVNRTDTTPDESTKETAEELILRLLEFVGVYPVGEG